MGIWTIMAGRDPRGFALHRERRHGGGGGKLAASPIRAGRLRRQLSRHREGRAEEDQERRNRVLRQTRRRRLSLAHPEIGRGLAQAGLCRPGVRRGAPPVFGVEDRYDPEATAAVAGRRPRGRNAAPHGREAEGGHHQDADVRAARPALPGDGRDRRRPGEQSHRRALPRFAPALALAARRAQRSGSRLRSRIRTSAPTDKSDRPARYQAGASGVPVAAISQVAIIGAVPPTRPSPMLKARL
jgi:hypothetical protein